jgi:hypothetical protein
MEMGSKFFDIFQAYHNLNWITLFFSSHQDLCNNIIFFSNLTPDQKMWLIKVLVNQIAPRHRACHAVPT